ncbi:hypothetical protein [Calothrix sp. 336/3]|nr:hypothetical protein [Calothrix sp. 336/3]
MNDFKHGLGECFGVIIILFLLMPLTALTLRATIQILTERCEAPYGGK